MSKLKNCPSCEKEVAKSAKVCPHCGRKLKIGLCIKLLIAIIIGIVIAMIIAPSSEDKRKEYENQLIQILQTPSSNISAENLYHVFALGSSATDLQRDELTKEVTGKVIDWYLPVYEVRKSDDNTYRIQTSSDGKVVGTFITIKYPTETEIQYINSLKTGDYISVKGIISGTFMRNLEIQPAKLL